LKQQLDSKWDLNLKKLYIIQIFDRLLKYKIRVLILQTREGTIFIISQFRMQISVLSLALFIFGLGIILPSGFVNAQSYSRVIENFDQTSTLRLVGSSYDNTLVRNCKIHGMNGDAIFIKDVKNVRIENCEIYDAADGIRLSISGSTEDVVIIDNYIHDIQNDGIGAGQRVSNGIDHKRLKILNNRVERTGLISANSGLYHGMYIQAQDFLIEGNTIMDSRDGNGISVRSSGVIRNNIVGNATKGPIAYFSDHMRGPSDTLLIENNIAYGNGIYAAIELLNIPNSNNVVRNFIIRFNTAISSQSNQYALQINNAYQGFNTRVYGNLLVNTESNSRILGGPIAVNSQNYETTSLANFKDSSQFDFRITSAHPAIGYAVGLTEFPVDDLEGDARSSSSLDAGADQFDSPKPQPPTCDLKITSPNGGERFDFNDTINVGWSGSVPGQVLLELLLNGSLVGSYSTTVSNSGALSFTAGTDLSASPYYKLRVSDYSNLGCQDSSDTNFSIGVPDEPEPVCSLTVESPNGGQIFRRGQSITANWSGATKSESPNIIIQLTKNEQVVGNYQAEVNNSGALTFTLGTDLTSSRRYKIKVIDSRDGTCNDSSNSYFRIR